MKKKLQTVDDQTLKQKDILLGMICVMFFLDTVGPVASMGASAITWSIIISVVFFFPSGLIMAEMGSTYPAEGGMYAWIKKAFGPKWGGRMSWLYWVNNAIWIPSISIFTVEVFCQVFGLELSFPTQLIFAISFIWLVVLFGFRPLKSATRLANFSGFFKGFIALAMGVMAVVFLLKGNAPANDLSLPAFKPKMDESFLFLSALIYNYLGFEVMSSMGNRIKNPAKDVPRATIANTFIISALYIVTILAILTIVPLKDLSIVDAIMSCFFVVDLPPILHSVVVYGVGAIFLAILFAQASTWIVGAGRLAAGAARDGELPKVFGISHKINDVPMGALLVTGVVGTMIALVYGLAANSAEDLFWTLFSFTNIIFLLPYIINFQAYLKLRKKKKDHTFGYRVFGPSLVGTIFARMGQIILIFTVIIIIFTPGKAFELMSCLGLVGGTVFVLLLGEYFVRKLH